MLETNLGKIVIAFDGKAAAFSVFPIENKRLFPDVDGAFLLKYDYANDGKAHTLRCFLDTCGVTGRPESGEALEAISFYSQGAKLTIGCKGDFGWSEKYDYSGSYLGNGLEIEIAPPYPKQSLSFRRCLATALHRRKRNPNMASRRPNRFRPRRVLTILLHKCRERPMCRSLSMF